MISLPIVRYVLMAALRDRLLLAFCLLVLVGGALSLFLGSAAVVESDAFSIVFAAGGLRMAGVAALVLFIVSYLRRAFETRDVDFLLSRPLSRTAFLLSHALAFTLIAAFFAAFIALAVCLLNSGEVGAGHALWALSLLVEYAILAQTALFFAMVIPTVTGGALAVLGFYVLARMIGQILGIATLGQEGSGFSALESVMEGVGLIVPRLDLMAQTGWLVYGTGDSPVGPAFILFQGGLYIGLLLCAALLDLKRRQF